jgi:hypothetical protein
MRIEPYKQNFASFKSAYMCLNHGIQNSNLVKIQKDFNLLEHPFNDHNKKEVIEYILKDAKKLSNATISKEEDLYSKIDFFLALGGRGSRFNDLSRVLGDYNKLTFPFYLNNGQTMQMTNFPMSLCKHVVPDSGYKILMDKAQCPQGSLSGIINYYLKHKNQIKDTLTIGGDNVLCINSKEAIRYLVNSINDKNINVALIGVRKAPEVIAGKSGVMKIEPTVKNDIFKIASFYEKPPIEVANEYAKTTGGKNVVNTGFTYISKAAMTKIVDEIQKEIKATGTSSIIKKPTSDTEIYDGGEAVKLIMAKSEEWFGKKTQDIARVKLIDNWEDVGEPSKYYKFLNDMKTQNYMQNFSNDYASSVRESVQKKVKLQPNGNGQIIISPKYDSFDSVPKSVIEKAPIIDGVKIIT